MDNMVVKDFTLDSVKEALPICNKNADKNEYGRTLIIAGSRDIYGACFLASKAAFKSGAGMVKVFTHINNKHSLEANLPEGMFIFYDENFNETNLVNAISWAHTVVIGPGLGTSELSKTIVSFVFDNISKKIVVADADCLNVFSLNSNLFTKCLQTSFDRQNNLVLTPNDRELNRMIKSLNFEDSFSFCQFLFSEYGVVTVKKGSDSLTFGEHIYRNTSGNDGMATAGSGDVLAGIMGGYLYRAPKNLPFEKKVAAAVFVHGYCGDLAIRNISTLSLMASDICDSISAVWNELSS